MIKCLTEEIEKLKFQKKSFNDEIDLKISEKQQKLDELIKCALGEKEFFEDEEVILTTKISSKKKIILLNVLKDSKAIQLLAKSLAEDKCNGSVTLPFEKELLGLPNYCDFLDVSPEIKIQVTFKEGV